MQTSPRAQLEAQAASCLAPYVVASGAIAVLVSLAGQYLAPPVLERLALYPLLLGMVFVGLPHGALDHLIPARLGLVWGKRPLAVSVYLLVYMAVAGAYLLLWLSYPLWAFVGFLLATVWHWGQGDLRFWEIFLQRRRPNAWGAAVSLLLRGSLPMVVPVLFFPEIATSLYQHASAGLGVAAAPIDLQAPLLVGSLVAYLLLLSVAYVYNAWRANKNPTYAALDIAEIVLLWLLFSTITAYLAIGIYFIAWHSLRHLARLLLLRAEDCQQIVQGQWRQPWQRLARDLTPITVLALLMLGALYWLSSARIASLEGFVALYLVFISALTKPHLLVVVMMDIVPAPLSGRATSALAARASNNVSNRTA